MRGRYRNSFIQPSPFTPNEIEKVAFKLPDIAHTFLKGHRLAIQVQSSWFPLVDMNPQQYVDIYHCGANDFVNTQISIHQGGETASRLIFKSIK
jgi:predicted acyl esterase